MKQEIPIKTVVAVVAALVLVVAIGLFAFTRGGAGSAGKTAQDVGLGEPVQPGMPAEGGANPSGPAGQ